MKFFVYCTSGNVPKHYYLPIVENPDGHYRSTKYTIEIQSVDDILGFDHEVIVTDGRIEIYDDYRE